MSIFVELSHMESWKVVGNPRTFILKENSGQWPRLDWCSPVHQLEKYLRGRAAGLPCKRPCLALQAVARCLSKDVLFSKEPGTRLSLGRAGLLATAFSFPGKATDHCIPPCVNVSSFGKGYLREPMTIQKYLERGGGGGGGRRGNVYM